MKEQYRHTNYRDIVPHVPAMDMFYRHTTQEVYADIDGNLTMCSTTDGEDDTCSNQFWSWQYSSSYHLSYLG